MGHILQDIRYDNLHDGESITLKNNIYEKETSFCCRSNDNCAAVSVIVCRDTRDSFFEANVEALASTEVGNHCPKPYDVPDHYLTYRNYEGRFYLDVDGYITIMGKRFMIPGIAGGAELHISYSQGDCLEVQEGACCPHSQNGEVKILGYLMGN